MQAYIFLKATGTVDRICMDLKYLDMYVFGNYFVSSSKNEEFYNCVNLNHQEYLIGSLKIP